MTEVEKMRNGLLADMSSPELQVRFEHAKKLLARMRGMSTYDEGYRKVLEEFVIFIISVFGLYNCTIIICIMLGKSMDSFL